MINRYYTEPYIPDKLQKEDLRYKILFVTKEAGAGWTYYLIMIYTHKARLIIAPERKTVMGIESMYNSNKDKDKPKFLFGYENSNTSQNEIIQTLNNGDGVMVTLAYFIQMTNYNIKSFYKIMPKDIMVIFDEIHRAIEQRTFTNHKNYFSKIISLIGKEDQRQLVFVTATPITEPKEIKNTDLFKMARELSDNHKGSIEPAHVNYIKTNKQMKTVNFYNNYKNGKLIDIILHMWLDELIPVIRVHTAKKIYNIIKAFERSEIVPKIAIIAGDKVSKDLRWMVDLNKYIAKEQEDANLWFVTSTADTGWSVQNPKMRLIFLRDIYTNERDIIQFINRERNKNTEGIIMENSEDIHKHSMKCKNNKYIAETIKLIPKAKQIIKELRDLQVHNEPKAYLFERLPKKKGVDIDKVIKMLTEGYVYGENKLSDTLESQLQSKIIDYENIYKKIEREFKIEIFNKFERHPPSWHITQSPIQDHIKCETFLNNMNNKFVELQDRDNYYLDPTNKLVITIIKNLINKDINKNKERTEIIVKGLIAMVYGEQPTKSQIQIFKTILKDENLTSFENFKNNINLKKIKQIYTNNDLLKYSFYTDTAVRNFESKIYIYNDTKEPIENILKEDRHIVWMFTGIVKSKNTYIPVRIKEQNNKNTKKAFYLYTKEIRKNALIFTLHGVRGLDKWKLKKLYKGNRDYNAATYISNDLIKKISKLYEHAFIEFDAKAFAPTIFFLLGCKYVSKEKLYLIPLMNKLLNKGINPNELDINTVANKYPLEYREIKQNINTLLNKISCAPFENKKDKIRKLKEYIDNNIGWTDLKDDFINIIKGNNILNINFLIRPKNTFYCIYTYIESKLMRESKKIKDAKVTYLNSDFRKHDGLQLLVNENDKLNIEDVMTRELKQINIVEIIKNDYKLNQISDLKNMPMNDNYFPYQ